MTKKSNSHKPLKWTTQRINLGAPVTHPSTKASYRVYKRTPSRTTVAMTAGPETLSSNQQQIECLERELAFTYDTFATITVHFESLYHTYASSKPQLDQFKSATRLGEMEKELLIAYDDLGLQVTHLERKIAKLEKRLAELRGTVASPPLEVASPCSSVDTFNTDPLEDCMYPFYMPTQCYPIFYPVDSTMMMHTSYPQPTFMM